MTKLELDDRDRALLAGHQGEALKFAMQLVVRAAEAMNARELIDAVFVHVDACHYYGRAHVDFARYFADAGARFEIPAWTNTVPVSLKQPEVRDDADAVALAEARELADLYLALGCKASFTCAPYQLAESPGRGEHIVGSESNAVAYFNAVVGARTNKYGDFLDVAAGLVARVPLAGLHTDAGRRGQINVDVRHLPDELKRREDFCHVLGYLIGKRVGEPIAVIDGLPADTHADSLKAISAAGAASGGVAMFHVVGVTPEAQTAADAFQGHPPTESLSVTMDMMRDARDALSSASNESLNMVALGTPHFSFSEFERLASALDGRAVHPDVTFYVSTARHIADLVAMHDWGRALVRAGVTILVDTCTYFAPAVRGAKGTVMTNSAKWAYYAPGMLPVDVVFGSLADCANSAVAGEVQRDERDWQ